MASRQIVFFGNCQAEVLAQVFQRRIGPLVDASAQFVDHSKEGAKEDVRKLLRHADAFVEQRFDLPSTIETDDLGPQTCRIAFPMVSAGFYWPYANQPHIRNERPWDPPYPAELGDRFLNGLIAKGTPTNDAVAEYLALDVPGRSGLDRLVELYIQRQRVRDDDTGLDVAGFIEAKYRDQHLFLTPGHPETAIFKLIAHHVYDQLEVPPSLQEQAFSALRETPFPLTQLPIHPSVIKHLGITFANEETRYKYFDEGHYTFEEYIRRYMDYEWNREMFEALGNDAPAGARLEKLQRALLLSPESVRGWHLKSRLLRTVGRLDEAEEAVNRAIAIDPYDPEGPSELAHVLLHAGKIDEAERAAHLALEMFPSHAPACRALAEISARRGDRVAAASFARRAVAAEPGNVDHHALLAEQLLAAGDLAAAEAAFLRAVELEPGVAGLWNGLAEVLHGLGRADEALAIVRRLIAEGSQDPHIHHRLGFFLAQAGELIEAESAFRSAIKLDRDPSGFHRSLADVLARLGRRHEALVVLQAQIDLGSGDPQVFHHKGHLLLQIDDLEGAEIAVRRAIELGPTFSHFRRTLVDILQRRGRRDEALRLLRQLIDEGTREPHIFNWLSLLLVETGDLLDAENAARFAIALDPSVPGFQNTLASVLQRSGRKQEALAIVQQLIDHGSRDPHIFSRKAELLLDIGDLSGATTAAEQAVELDPDEPGFRGTLAAISQRRKPIEI
jgi:Flp pilus assembly protein TadD